MMSRKKFIESQGATCDNWTWSWSFVNHKEKVVIFGAWDIYTKGNMALIFSKDWEINSRGRKSPGFDQSLEHLRLIEKQGYKLKTFAMKYSDAQEVRPHAQNGPKNVNVKCYQFDRIHVHCRLSNQEDSRWISDSRKLRSISPCARNN